VTQAIPVAAMSITRPIRAQRWSSTMKLEPRMMPIPWPMKIVPAIASRIATDNPNLPDGGVSCIALLRDGILAER